MNPLRPRLFAVATVLLLSAPALALQPIVTDSRIKTFVYNPNEVYAMTTEYGYQSNIEFGERETIDTVSIGDRVSWQIIPSGRRLFIRAMEENAHTNMTVVTNKRAYQFDLRSSGSERDIGSEALTYVVRFFYPQDQADNGVPPAAYAGEFAPPQPMVTQAAFPVNASPAPQMQQPVSTGAIPPAMQTASAGYNYRYTYSGPSSIAPLKIYDDGRTTYFKFRPGTSPSFSVITASGSEMSVPTHAVAPDTVAVDAVAPRFSLRQAGQQVVVYNEANGA